MEKYKEIVNMTHFTKVKEITIDDSLNKIVYFAAGITILVIFFFVGYTYAYDEGNFWILLQMLIYGFISFFVFLFIYSICKRLDIIIHNQNQQ
jgi:RsiW-degrading membrane proteinase PrsW (M82 family)